MCFRNPAMKWHIAMTGFICIDYSLIQCISRTRTVQGNAERERKIHLTILRRLAESSIDVQVYLHWISFPYDFWDTS